MKTNNNNKKYSQFGKRSFGTHSMYLALMTRGFSMALSLLKVGILGYVWKGTSPLSDSLRGSQLKGFFSPLFFLV
jgi:hypothetical protein